MCFWHQFPSVSWVYSLVGKVDLGATAPEVGEGPNPVTGDEELIIERLFAELGYPYECVHQPLLRLVDVF